MDTFDENDLFNTLYNNLFIQTEVIGPTITGDKALRTTLFFGTRKLCESTTEDCLQ